MRTLAVLALTLGLTLISGRARADEASPEARLKYEAELAAIADRDMHTARLEQETAQDAIEGAKATHNKKALVYWVHRLEQARKDEETAMEEYAKHRLNREIARDDVRRKHDRRASK